MYISAGIFHQILAAIPVFVNEVSLGLGYGWTAPTIRQLQNSTEEISLNSEQSSWLASMLEVGRMFSPLLACFFVDKWGRKVMLSSCMIICFLSWFALIFTTSIPIICGARLFFGISVGMWDVCTSIYIGENSSPQIRAIIGSVSMASFYGGELFDFVLATCFPYKLVIFVNTALSFLALFCILLIMETPHYLVMNKKYEKAEKNFNWLRGVNRMAPVASDHEFENLKYTVLKESEKKLTLRELLLTPLYCRTISMVLGLCVLMMLTGSGAVTAFASVAFSESEIFTPYQFTILFGLLQFVTVAISSAYVERFNRRTILRFSLALVAVVQTLTALLYYVDQYIAPVPYFPWLIFLTITSYAMIYSGGLHPLFYIIRGEVFPQKIKPIGGCIGVMGNSLAGFLSTKAFLIVAETYGIFANFVAFAMFSLIATFYVHFIVPETKGKTLIEIQESMINTAAEKGDRSGT